VVEVCLDVADGGDQRGLECMEAAGVADWDPVDLVLACDDVMDGDLFWVACVRAGARAVVDPSEAVLACGDEYGSDDVEELACLELTARPFF
jgi:hypothetical protein